MSISEHFRYWNDVFQSDIFVSDIGITDVDVGYRISPTLRSMSMPTYAVLHMIPHWAGLSRDPLNTSFPCLAHMKVTVHFLGVIFR
jgi:hypothetical protein